MTKNLKNYETARAALVKLQAQLAAEAKSDPRFARGKHRCDRLIAALDMAQTKYEIVHGRKVPAKVKQRKAAKAGVAKKIAKRKARETAEVIELPVAKAATAAARKRAAVKRSAKK